MANIPEDIIEENILTRLPVKSIARFRCVSKSWHLLFRNPKFIKKHLNHAIHMNKFNILVTDYRNQSYSIDNAVLSSTSSPFLGHVLEIDYPFISRECLPRILGSCNGLVCIESLIYLSITIWNPATNEYTIVPEATDANVMACCYTDAYGFGFDCKNDDYKVLRILSFDNGKEFSEPSIYSLASNSWKALGFIPYDLYSAISKMFLVEGVLNWLATVTYTGIKCSAIVSFDISDETFRDMPLPYNNSIEDHFMSELGIWEGKLCLLHRNSDHTDVWTMMDNKWSKHLKIIARMADAYNARPVQTLANGEILFAGRPMVEEGNGLVSYDPNLERAINLKVHGFPDMSNVETYIETLVALNSGTYVGKNKKSNKGVEQERKETDNND